MGDKLDQQEQWEQAYRTMTHTFNPAAHTRAEYRAAWHGSERAEMQQVLVHLAEGAKAGSKADRLSLYKAAYAVLPLHGQSLAEFIDLLLQDMPPSPQWTDAFLEALAELTGSDPQRLTGVLEALHSLHRMDANTPAGRRRAHQIAYHVRKLGFMPSWLPSEDPIASSETVASGEVRPTTSPDEEI